MIRSKALFAALVLGCAANAFADVVEYTDRAAWDADADRLSGANWELYVTGTNGVGSWDGTDGVDDEITFTNLNSGNPPLIFADTFSGANGPLHLGTGNVIASGFAGMQVTFPAANGFGLDIRGYQQSATTFNVTLSTGEILSTTVTNPTGGFYGILTDTDITSVTFVAVGNDNVIMDNFFVSYREVPAPGGMLMLVGLIGLLIKRRQR